MLPSVLTKGRLAHAAEDAELLADLDFFRSDKSVDHRRILQGQPRYVMHDVFGDAAGILVEDAMSNGVEDAGFRNSAPVPKGWRMPSEFVLPMPCDTQFVVTAPGRGRLTMRGTSAGDYYITLGSARYFPIKAGDNLTGSVSLRLASDERRALKRTSLLILENNATGAVARSGVVEAPIQHLQTDKAWWSQAGIVARQDGFANLALKVSITGPFDITFDINSPQLEKRTWRSSFAADSRTADRITLSPKLDYLSQPRRSVLITADAPRHMHQGSLWSEYIDATNYIALTLRQFSLYAQTMTNGVLAETRLGVLPPLMRFTVCLTIRDAVLSGTLNGKPLKSIDAPNARPREVRIGDGPAGLWSSTIGQIKLFKGVPFDPALESRPDQTFFDDFDRPDSSDLGQSPTGHRIERTGNAETRIQNGKWVATSSAAGPVYAAYGKVRMQKPPRYMGAVVIWTVGATGGSVALIAATNNLVPPTNALHTVASDQADIFQTITDSKVDDALTFYVLPKPMKRDGISWYGKARLLQTADNAVVFVGQDGALARHVSSTYISRLGTTAVFEHFWQRTQTRPEILSIGAF